METLKNLTLVQWIGIMVGLNSLLMGATPQLTVLFGAAAVPIIVAVATLGNGALGVFVTVVGGMPSQVRNVLAMPGVDRIAVNGQANAALATLAVDPDQNKIAPTPAAQAAVTAIARAAAVILFAFMVVGLMFVQPASAARRATKAPAATVPAAAPVNPFQTFLDQLNKKAAAINAFTLNDAQAAMAMAKDDPTGLACYTAIANKIQTNTPGNILPTSLGLLQLIETARLAKLQVAGIQNGTDPVVSGCAALILDANTTLLMLAGQGAVGAAGLTIGLPPIPGL